MVLAKLVRLISTSATIANRIYETKFKENNIDFVTPNDLQRTKMDKIIQRLIEWSHLNKDREFILEVVSDISK